MLRAEEEVCHMFSAMQYRLKAAEFKALLAGMPRSSNEAAKLRDLQQAYSTLAENEEWLSIHDRKTTERTKRYDNRVDEEEQILRCLGAAVIMLWNVVPTKLQRELFDCASTIGDLQQIAPLKGQMARFLHDHKDGHRSPALRNNDTGL
jgi:hypothetical protein